MHEELTFASQAVTSHPKELVLKRYAANETGKRGRKEVANHLEVCSDCRAAVLKFRTIARRFRDLERVALKRAVTTKS